MIVAVLDACVLYPPSLRDLLLWLTSVRVYSPRWTEQIHDERMLSLRGGTFRPRRSASPAPPAWQTCVTWGPRTWRHAAIWAEQRSMLPAPAEVVTYNRRKAGGASFPQHVRSTRSARSQSPRLTTSCQGAPGTGRRRYFKADCPFRTPTPADGPGTRER